jgi:peptide/nickel transport system ATP-binding protein
VGGRILYHRRTDAAEEVVDLAQLDPFGREIRAIRGAEIAMIFQEPMTSFSPIHTIGNQIVEAIRLHRSVDKVEARALAIDALRRVGMSRPEHRIDQYPHELSGGMRQRAMIAMAMCCNPQLLLADEPTTALDVTTQAQILELMRDLQQDTGAGVVMITHDLGVIAEIAQSVVVMYLGRVVEVSDVRALFRDPKHPYTRALLQSIPRIGRGARVRLQPVTGMVPSPYNRPTGCPFHPRCPAAMPGVCDRVVPEPVALGDGREVSCHLYGSGEPARD